MTREELLRLYSQGQRNFSGIYLKDVNVGGREGGNEEPVGATLDGINLTGANLFDVNFLGCSLIEANFSAANIERTVFDVANLTRSKFRRAKFSDVDMIGCILTESDMRESSFSTTDMTNADLTRANMQGAIGIEVINLDGTYFFDTIVGDGSIYTYDGLL